MKDIIRKGTQFNTNEGWYTILSVDGDTVECECVHEVYDDETDEYTEEVEHFAYLTAYDIERRLKEYDGQNHKVVFMKDED